MKTVKILGVTFLVALAATIIIYGIELLVGPVMVYLGAMIICFIASLWALINLNKTNKREQIYKQHRKQFHNE